MFNCFSRLFQQNLHMFSIFRLSVFFVSALLTSHTVAEVLRGSFHYTCVTYHEFISGLQHLLLPGGQRFHQ